ncbi:hypothetical protein HK101_002726 [Irineochytrium annulatum]|nr:hypothetical protein HK101_002726 [Irineochytrium annulatum]
MPRKDFVAHLNEAKLFHTQLGDADRNHVISSVRAGDDDGMVVFRFKKLFAITVWIQELGDYPSRATGIMYVEDETTQEAKEASSVLQTLQVEGLSVMGIIHLVATRLCAHFRLPTPAWPVIPSVTEATNCPAKRPGGSSSTLFPPSVKRSLSSARTPSSNADEEDEDEDDDDEIGFSDIEDSSTPRGPHVADVRRRLCRDLGAMQANLPRGARVGVLWIRAEDDFIVYCSIRVSACVRDGLLSKDQANAWNLELGSYFVMLIKFEETYIGFGKKGGEHTILGAEPDGTRSIPMPKPQFKVLVAGSPVVSAIEAYSAFRIASANKGSLQDLSGGGGGGRDTAASASGDLRDFLLSKTLADLMTSRFVLLLSYRLKHPVAWAGAEMIFDKRHSIAGEPGDPTFFNSPSAEQMQLDYNLCEKADGEELKHVAHHCQQLQSEGYTLIDPARDREEYVNVPLLAMQYALRRIHLAAKFCLVCHRKPKVDLEALRPFVCDRVLCTYQYMQVGLGPNIEEEILHNPNVVDLLVSLAYAADRSMLPFPYGVGCNVSKLYGNAYGEVTAWSGTEVYGTDTKWLTAPASKDEKKSEPQIGDVMEIRYKNQSFRSKVALIHDDLHLSLENPVGSPLPSSIRGMCLPFWLHRNEYVGFSLDPDESKKKNEGALIRPLLEKMPSIRTLQNELRKMKGLELLPEEEEEENPDDIANVDEEVEEEEKIDERLLPPQATAGPIFYATRSTELSLRPVMDLIDPLLYPFLRWLICSNRGYMRELKDDREKIVGIEKEYVQFQLVLGSPEKEERFVKERAKEAPDHGLNLTISLGYSQMGGGAAYWPKSRLKVQTCISVNEIVNSPDKFQSKNPYLVVQHVDWVQTRYFLVRSGTAGYHTFRSDPVAISARDNEDLRYIPADLRYPIANGSTVVRIPSSVATNARLASELHEEEPELGKDPLLVTLEEEEREEAAGEVDRMDEDEKEDSEDGYDDDGDYGFVDPRKASSKATAPQLVQEQEIDFSMPPPSYATTSASRALQKELSRLVRLQQTTDVRERGWEIDFEGLLNLYQWTIRLVNFDESLPLATDMMRKGIYAEGVTLECRFGPDYPLSPPYLRVIKPRFLQFINGGGGHVTAGGSICMDLLTSSGWLPTYALDATLLQVRMALTSLDPKPARLDHGERWREPYTAREAIDAFVRVARAHNWEVPRGWETYFSASG